MNQPVTVLSFARKHEITFEMAQAKLEDLIANGKMIRARMPNGRTYYVSTAPEIKAHDPFNLCNTGESDAN